MKSIKNFLIGFTIVYLTVPSVALYAMGGPNFSRDFLDEHKDGLDRYLEITKSTPYKKWAQSPESNPPDETLQERIAFVEEFEAIPAYQSEVARRTRYDMLSDLFNSGMLIVLIVGLARGPIANLLDGMVAEERARVETAEEVRSVAARRKANAEHKLEGLEIEREESEELVAKRIETDATDIEQTTARALEQLRLEAEDRKRQEELLAQRQLKAAMVDEAIAILAERYTDETDAQRDAALIDRFLSELGQQS